MGFFYELIDIHSIKEEGADCLFGWLRGNVEIESI